MLSGLSSLGVDYSGKGYLPAAKISNEMSKPQDESIFSGMTLSLTEWGSIEKNDISDLNSSQFGLFDIKSINGYSPVGYKNINNLFPYYSAHGNFIGNDTLERILNESEIQGNCLAENFKINTIIMNKELYSKYRDRLVDCGFSKNIESSKNNLYVIKPNNGNTYLPSTDINKLNMRMINHGNNYETIEILEPSDTDVKLIFPRLW